MNRKSATITGVLAALALTAGAAYAPVRNIDTVAGAQTGVSGVVVAALTTTGSEPRQSCSDGTISATGCGERERGVQVARGNECPAASGKYCDDKTPYCCGVPGDYYCAIDVNHC